MSFHRGQADLNTGNCNGSFLDSLHRSIGSVAKESSTWANFPAILKWARYLCNLTKLCDGKDLELVRANKNA